jgi:glycine betaine/proline transport system permease protein
MTPRSGVDEFAAKRAHYYEREFAKIEQARGFVWSFNGAASLLGPIWAGARGVWGFFWLASFAEILALIQLGRGWFGSAGSEILGRASRLHEAAQLRLAEAQTAAAAGRSESAETFQRIARNLEQASLLASEQAKHAAAGASTALAFGVFMIVLIKAAEGFLANSCYERQYTAWRARREVASGIQFSNIALSSFLIIATYPLTIYRFTAPRVPPWLIGVPIGKQWFAAAARALDTFFDGLYRFGSTGFDAVRDLIRDSVHALETVLVGTPWPVIMTVIIVAAWRIAGRRMAVVTTAVVAYLASLGLWEQSMQTVALLGTAALICVTVGIPLGIWFAKSDRAYTVARPVLDLMQTMPALVYLIPAIAFFGTGTPPGIIATLVFGLPPVVRLTALGLKQVPESIREAARAYGASSWRLLMDVDLPLAAPAIMAGINQTILMCLSMVVIAALIGAQGLGSSVLEALQYAATGQGILAGVAILLCAIVIDRLVQGSLKFSKGVDTADRT